MIFLDKAQNTKIRVCLVIPEFQCFSFIQIKIYHCNEYFVVFPDCKYNIV